MGKRKGQIAKMGRSMLVKDIGKKHGYRPNAGGDSFLHTTELDDGTTYNRINFQSVTEQNNLEDFLTTAEMAGKDFTAERLNIQIITQTGAGSRLTNSDLQKISLAQDANRALLQIPRRPKWDENTTKEDLVIMERDSFTDWRRQLKQLEEKEHIQLTPYEKNLDFWRQLWRVIERSDVVVQIVDARNPLLFRCEDLEVYVKEVDPRKTVMLLINKADFLTHQQRQQWVEHFNQIGLQVVFFSAKVEKEKQEEVGVAVSSDIDEEDEQESEEDDDNNDNDDADCNSDDDDDDDDMSDNEENNKEELNFDNNDNKNICSKNKFESPKNVHSHLEKNFENLSSGEKISSWTDPLLTDVDVNNSPEIVSADELLDIFRKLAHPASLARSDGVKTVGMVGYPNVGKSSTINVILNEKKLAVSATPGRTKHLQTLYVDQHLMLCDCPGLVFPSFVTTKAHLVINGILPIDEMRDHISPINLVCECIPRNVLEATYSIMIPRPSVDDAPDRIPTAEEFLNAYGAMRGFMTARGVPDGPRSSRYILKDFVKGRLLYCEPPPGIDAATFQDQERISVLEKAAPTSKIPPKQIRSDIDKEFFTQKNSKAHYRGNGVLSQVVGAHSHPTNSKTSHQETDHSAGFSGSTSSLAGAPNKPWKKHNNRNKKEKLRRLHRELDV